MDFTDHDDVSGYCYRMARRARANAQPMSALAWIWVMSAYSYSTRSSTLMILLSQSFTSSRVSYNVMDFPEPVGTVTKITP